MEVMLFLVFTLTGQPPQMQQYPIASIQECLEAAESVLVNHAKLFGDKSGLLQASCVVKVDKMPKA
jgi:hypothetical protein